MHGKMSIKKLVGEGEGVSSIEVTDGNEIKETQYKVRLEFPIKEMK